jgi:hypothetical protein
VEFMYFHGHFLLLKHAWEFPNLSHIFFRVQGTHNTSQSIHLLKYFIVSWVEKLSPHLTSIELPDRRLCCMDVEDIVKLCENRPRLKHIKWSSIVSVLVHWAYVLSFVHLKVIGAKEGSRRGL